MAVSVVVLSVSGENLEPVHGEVLRGVGRWSVPLATTCQDVEVVVVGLLEANQLVCQVGGAPTGLMVWAALALLRVGV